MSDPKQKKQLKLLGGLLAVLLLVLYWTWGGSSPAPSSSTGQQLSRSASTSLGIEDFVLRTRQRRDRRGRRAIPVSKINPTIHFEKLGQMETVKPSLARNMFAFYSPPSPRSSAGSSSQQPRAVLRPQPVAPRQTSSAQHRSVAINLKFYGFKRDEEGKQRQGFFADGDEVYIAWEGQLVANRYRIHRITDTMAEVEEVRSKTKKRLNLVTQ